ncbi:MAG: hypothetical protein JO139_02505 [Alphaproteobacteria bacterium]|nr:hypothetical protein [Alphaproteobacteria bacterium]
MNANYLNAVDLALWITLASAKWMANKNSKRLAIGNAGHIGEGTLATGKRVSGVEITPFDSTGIALQDSAMMPVEYERAAAVGVGVEKKMILT